MPACPGFMKPWGPRVCGAALCPWPIPRFNVPIWPYLWGMRIVVMAGDFVWLSKRLLFLIFYSNRAQLIVTLLVTNQLFTGTAFSVVGKGW